MFNLGAGEVMLIAVLALLVLGPDRIPSAMRQVGRVMGELRRYSNGFRDELRSALDDADPQPQPHSQQRELFTPPAAPAPPPAPETPPTDT